MADTSIEWTNRVWNPVRGCARVSPGCEHCYAEVMASRFSDPGQWGHGFAERTEHGGRWTRVVKPVPETLAAPLHWRKPRRVFVNSTSDLFHEDVPDSYIAAVFGVMAACPQHTFQVLTKRPERMARWFEWARAERERRYVGGLRIEPSLVCMEAAAREMNAAIGEERRPLLGNAANEPWPLPNVWLGVSVEDQRRADERIPALLRVPAAVRFLSCEPLLGPVDLDLGRCDAHDRRFIGIDSETNEELCNECAADGASGELSFGHWLGDPDLGIHWVIVGGESGPGARPFDLAWCRSLVGQCRAAGVPVFVKQLGARPEWNGHGSAWEPPPSPQMIVGDMNESGRFALRLVSTKGGDPAEWPEDLRVREWPEVRHG